MTKNVGKTDRIIRVIIGLVLMVVSLVTNIWIGVLGLVVLMTGLVGWCGLYKVFGINTCPHEITSPAPTEIPNNESTQN